MSRDPGCPAVGESSLLDGVRRPLSQARRCGPHVGDLCDIELSILGFVLVQLIWPACVCVCVRAVLSTRALPHRCDPPPGALNRGQPQPRRRGNSTAVMGNCKGKEPAPVTPKDAPVAAPVAAEARPLAVEPLDEAPRAAAAPVDPRCARGARDMPVGRAHRGAAVALRARARAHALIAAPQVPDTRPYDGDRERARVARRGRVRAVGRRDGLGPRLARPALAVALIGSGWH